MLHRQQTYKSVEVIKGMEPFTSPISTSKLAPVRGLIPGMLCSR